MIKIDDRVRPTRGPNRGGRIDAEWLDELSRGHSGPQNRISRPRQIRPPEIVHAPGSDTERELGAEDGATSGNETAISVNLIEVLRFTESVEIPIVDETETQVGTATITRPTVSQLRGSDGSFYTITWSN